MAIFSEAQRYGGYAGNAFAILDEATYLTEEESNVYPSDVPVAENSRIGHYVVKFEDIASLAESAGCDYIDAMLVVAEHNQIDPSSMAVVVNEADIISDPSIVYGLANVVVAPVSETCLASRYADAVLEEYFNGGAQDDQFLYDALVEFAYLDSFLEATGDTYSGGAGQMWSGMKQIGGAAANTAGAAWQKIKDALSWMKTQAGNAMSKGRNFVSSLIAKLRGVYADWLNKMNSKEMQDKPGVLSALKRGAAAVLKIIDSLLGKIGKGIATAGSKEEQDHEDYNVLLHDKGSN